MATGSVGYTAGSGTLIRVVTNAAVDSGADQQIVTLADSAGNLLGTTGAPLPVSQSTLPAGTNTIGNVKLTDGTNVATVKAASTAAVATDTGQVVALHPSSPLPAGTNALGTVALTAGAAAIGSVTLGAGTAYAGQVRLTDGTNNPAVKAASTAAAAADPSLVVALHPSSPLPPGTSTVGAFFIGNTVPTAFATTSAASTNATNVKAASGSLQEVTISNPTATVAYFKLFNKTSAPTVGTDLPIAIFRVAAAGSAGDTLELTFGPNGKRFNTGISWALTGAVAAADTTSAVAGVLISGTYV